MGSMRKQREARGNRGKLEETGVNREAGENREKQGKLGGKLSSVAYVPQLSRL